MRGAFILVLAMLSCADVIGADFGDASLAGDSVSESSGDVGLADSQLPDAGTFNPSAIAGLALWLDATTGVDITPTDAGVLVATWHDRSGKGHDAVPTGLAGTSAPAVVASAMNGHPVVHFTASAVQMLRDQWIGPGGDELTIFLVTRGYAMSALRFQTDVAAPPYVILPLDPSVNAANPTFYFYTSPVDDAGIVINGYGLRTETTLGVELYTARWGSDGTAATFRDGVLVEQLVGLPPHLPTAQLYIGGVYPGMYTMDGDIAEALVYSVALDDVARQQVEDYLRNKWGA